MNRANSPYGLLSATVLTFGSIATPISAQITPDTTLPNNSVVLPNGNVITIEGGTEAGMNLFHSFQEFSIPTGEEAFFNNTLSIENIITRVTGGNLSDIDGLIRANGAANLFLLNPSGIVFGPNARLEIGGSFFGTTAESLLFEDGTAFSTTSAATSPLLTVSVPVGLQWGGNSGPIRMEGDGHALTRDNLFFDPFDRSQVVPDLAVTPGRTLALLGSDIDLTGSTVAVSGGRLELGSPRTGTVALTPVGEGWDFDYTDVSEWGNVRLSQQALADLTGEGVTLQVRGENLELQDGSLLLVQNNGLMPTEIRIEVTDTVLASGTNPDATIPSGIANQNLGTGSGTRVEIAADRLLIQDGASLESTTFASGSGGSWQVDLDSDLEISGRSPLSREVQSGLYARTVAAGQGGDITVTAEQILLLDAGSIEASTIGSGMGGDISIVAESLEIALTGAPLSGSTSLQSGSFNAGDGGNTNVDVERLILRNGGRISASALAEGNGGSITISASESITIDGVAASNGNPSEVRADVREAGQGVQRRFGSPPTPSGRGGQIVIDTPRLYLDNHGQINVNNEGPAAAGQAIVRADTIFLDNEGTIAAATASGEGGSLTLVSDSLQLRHGSDISAEAGGTGNGGNIAIDAETIALLENSSINANAFEGAGGNIEITTRGLFVAPDSSITASSQFGVDGIVTVNNPIVDPASGLVALDGDTLDRDTRVRNSCAAAVGNRFVIAGSGGLPEDPTEFLRGRTVWQDTRLGEIQSHLTPNPTETIPQASATPPVPLVEATGWRTNSRGQIELIVASGNPSHSSWQPHPECNSNSQESRGMESFRR